MLFKITTISAVAALISNASAVWVCTGYNSNTGGCTGTCKEFDIAVNQQINVPQTACIFNSASDTGFDALICGAENLGEPCSLLSTRRRVTITGDFNWDAGQFTHSMKRTGN